MVSKNELALGDWVRDEAGFPMYVIGLYDDVAYLDFPENEGDCWEEEFLFLQPITITDHLLEKMGFYWEQKITAERVFAMRSGEYIISFTPKDRTGNMNLVILKNNRLHASYYAPMVLHQLQQIVRFVTGIEIAPHDLNKDGDAFK